MSETNLIPHFMLLFNSKSLINRSRTEVMVPLKEVNETSRDKFVSAINSLNPGGGTCLGNGIMRGMDVSLH